MVQLPPQSPLAGARACNTEPGGDPARKRRRHMRTQAPSESKRGWGPFNSRQLTVIVVVAIVSIVIVIPTAALAAVGTFSSTTSAPAVTAANTATTPNAV